MNIVDYFLPVVADRLYDGCCKVGRSMSICDPIIATWLDVSVKKLLTCGQQDQTVSRYLPKYVQRFQNTKLT